MLWFLEPGIQDSRIPEVPWNWLVLPDFNMWVMNHTQFMSKNLNFNLEFQNFIIPGIFQELSGTLELLWKWTNFWQVWRIGYFFHSVFSLELDFQGGIQKFHHSWNLLGIIWNYLESWNVFNRASHINTGMDRPTKIFDFWFYWLIWMPCE